MWRQAVKKNFVLQKKNKTKQPIQHKIMQKIIALALLPEAEIESKFLSIKMECRKKKVKNHEAFLNYYQETWIQGFTPKCFSVYKQIHRTNNYIEAYHRVLNSMITSTLNRSSFLSKFLFFFFYK